MQIVISLNALLAGRQMLVANDSGQFLATDGEWHTLGTPFAIDAVSPEDCVAQLKDLVETFWQQITQDQSNVAQGTGNVADPYYQSPNIV